jgi:hypothetical protein
MSPREPLLDPVLATDTRTKDDINPAIELDLDASPGDLGFENIPNFRDVGLTINEHCGSRWVSVRFFFFQTPPFLMAMGVNFCDDGDEGEEEQPRLVGYLAYPTST